MSNCWQVVNGKIKSSKYKTLDLALQHLSQEVNLGNITIDGKIKYLYSKASDTKKSFLKAIKSNNDLAVKGLKYIGVTKISSLQSEFTELDEGVEKYIAILKRELGTKLHDCLIYLDEDQVDSLSGKTFRASFDHFYSYLEAQRYNLSRGLIKYDINRNKKCVIDLNNRKIKILEYNSSIDKYDEKESIDIDSSYTKEAVEQMLNKSIQLFNLDQEKLIRYVNDVYNTINKEFKGYTFISEKDIYFHDKVNQDLLDLMELNQSKLIGDYGEDFLSKFGGLKGRLDAIAIDNDGNVVIIDYKTHSEKRNGVAPYNELQLQLYKHMLSVALGVDLKNIRLKVVDIQLSNIGNKVSISDVTNGDQARIASKMIGAPFVVKLNSPLNQLRIRGNNTLKKVVKSERLGIKDSQEFKDYLLDLYNNKKKQYRSILYKNVLVELNGDQVKIGNITMTLDEFVEKELEEKLSNYAERVEKVAEIFANIQHTFDPSELKQLARNRSNDVYKENFYKNLKRYYSGEYEYIPNQGLELHGYITLRNILDNSIDIIKLHGYSNLDYIVKRDNGTTILGDYISDEQLIKYKDILPVNSVANQEILKCLVLLHEYSDAYSFNFNINNIVLVNSETGTVNKPVNIENVNNVIRIFNEVNTNQKLKFNDQIGVNSFKNQLENYVFDMYQQLIGSIEKESIINEDKQIYIKNLESLISDLKRDFSSKIAPGTEYDQLVNYINWLILTIQNFDFQDYYRSGKYNLDWDNSFGMLFSAVKRGDVAKYARNGYIITGLAQGVDTSMALSNPDKVIHQINSMTLGMIDVARRALIKEGKEINDATAEFIDYYKGKVSQMITWDNSSLYKMLLQKDKNSNISSAMLLLNPFDKKIDAPVKKYLEVVLWNLNKRKRELKIDEKYRNMTYDEFKKTEAFKIYVDYINDPSERGLEYPLRRAHAADLIKSKFGNVKLSKATWSDIISQFEESVDLNNYIDDEKVQANKQRLEYKMFNRYDKTVEQRDKMLQEKSVDFFEFNVNAVVLDFVFSNIKETVFNDVLKNVDRTIGTIRLLEQMTGEPLENLSKGVIDRIKIAIFNENVREDELEQINKAQAAVRKFNSFAKIAFRKGLLVKEMISAQMKLLSGSTFGYFNTDGIGVKEISQALCITFGNDTSNDFKRIFGKPNLSNFSLVGLLNNTYGIANFDFNIAVDKLKHDRYNGKNALDRTAYLNATLSDFYHRMTYFIACMIHDGTFKAHTVNSRNELVYDFTKDERFKEFWAHRNDSNYNTQTFHQQKALYMSMVEDFNNYGYNIKAEPGNYEPLPHAYSPKQKQSINETINTLFGAYDHELSPTSQHTQYAHLHLQFLTFLPTELKKWFSAGNSNTSIGKFEQQYDKLTGEKLYKKKDAQGRIIIIPESKLTEEEKQSMDLYFDFTKHPVDGLVVSFCKALNSIFVKKDFFKEKCKSNDPSDIQMVANTKIFLFNMLIGLLMGLILKLILGQIEYEDTKYEGAIVQAQEAIIKASKELPIEAALGPLHDTYSKMAGYDSVKSLAETVVNVATIGDPDTKKNLFKVIAADNFSFVEDELEFLNFD